MTVATGELIRYGFVAIQYPPAVRMRANELVEKWVAFCNLSLKEKLKLANVEDCEYQLKDGSGYRDHKETLDIKLRGIDSLLKAAGTVESAVASELIECARSVILDAVSPVAARFAEKLERLYGIKGLEAEVMRGLPIWQLRLLHYLDTTPGKEVAVPHTDKAGITLHLHESGPGLQYLDRNKAWHDVSFGNGQTVIFPGLQLQLRSNGVLTGLCHRVIGDERCVGDRYSAVCFVLLADTPMYDKDRLGPSQGQEPGYNYGLPLEKLKEFFGEKPARLL